MGDAAEFENVIGLADFLSDLRTELAVASRRAEGESLKLGVEELTVSLDVGVTVGRKASGSAGVKAKFWVFASAEAKLQAEASRQRMTTQHLTLTLKPRIDIAGATRGVDVEGEFAAGEERPRLPGASEPAERV
jgi:hypothetical protein